MSSKSLPIVGRLRLARSHLVALSGAVLMSAGSLGVDPPLVGRLPVWLLGAVLFVLGELASLQRKQTQDELTRRLSAAEASNAAHQATLIDLIRRELTAISSSLDFASDERISLYVPASDNLRLIGRYSPNKALELHGRTVIPCDQGSVGIAWRETSHYVTDLPDPTTDKGNWIQRQLDMGLREETVVQLRMKSRTYASLQVVRAGDEKTLGVIGIESQSTRDHYVAVNAAKSPRLRRDEVEDVVTEHNGRLCGLLEAASRHGIIFKTES